MNIDNKQYLTAFLFSGFVGIGCKMILSSNAREEDNDILNNIPIASAISCVLFLSALKLLPDIEIEEDR